MRLAGLLASAAALAVAGCGGGERLVGRSDLAVVSGDRLPPPTERDLIAPPRPYLIGPFDSISIEVFGIPELARAAQVDSEGRISVPLIGSIVAAGRTPAQLGEVIAQRLRENHVLDPQVTVNLTTSLSQTVTVDGEVIKPGIYPIQGRMTLMRAVARAEGLGEDARQNYVVVFRRVDDREMAALYDLRAIRAGMYADPDLYANDVVYVGETNARRLFQAALTTTAILAAPLVTLVR